MTNVEILAFTRKEIHEFSKREENKQILLDNDRICNLVIEWYEQCGDNSVKSVQDFLDDILSIISIEIELRKSNCHKSCIWLTK